MIYYILFIDLFRFNDFLRCNIYLFLTHTEERREEALCLGRCSALKSPSSVLSLSKVKLLGLLNF